MSQQAGMGVHIPCLVIRAVAGAACCDSSLHGAHFILSTVQPAAVPPVVLLNSLAFLTRVLRLWSALWSWEIDCLYLYLNFY